MSRENSSEESELELFSRFSSAFSHVLRGDLSVITNEVVYLATQMPSGELERVTNRCSQMARTVSKIAGLQNEVAPIHVDMSELGRIFGVEECPRDPAMTIRVDRVKVERFASILRELLPGARTSLSSHGVAGELSVILQSTTIPRSVGRYASWSGFAARELGERSVIDAVVADLITRAHGWSVSISAQEDGILCDVMMPVVVEPALSRANP